jgi:hypothetical protein
VSYTRQDAPLLYLECIHLTSQSTCGIAAMLLQMHHFHPLTPSHLLLISYLLHHMFFGRCKGEYLLVRNKKHMFALEMHSCSQFMKLLSLINPKMCNNGKTKTQQSTKNGNKGSMCTATSSGSVSLLCSGAGVDRYFQPASACPAIHDFDGLSFIYTINN